MKYETVQGMTLKITIGIQIKSALVKIIFIILFLFYNFLISQPKHMLRVLKRTVSMRRFF